MRLWFLKAEAHADSQEPGLLCLPVKGQGAEERRKPSACQTRGEPEPQSPAHLHMRLPGDNLQLSLTQLQRPSKGQEDAQL